MMFYIEIEWFLELKLVIVKKNNIVVDSYTYNNDYAIEEVNSFIRFNFLHSYDFFSIKEN